MQKCRLIIGATDCMLPYPCPAKGFHCYQKSQHRCLWVVILGTMPTYLGFSRVKHPTWATEPDPEQVFTDYSHGWSRQIPNR